LPDESNLAALVTLVMNLQQLSARVVDHAAEVWPTGMKAERAYVQRYTRGLERYMRSLPEFDSALKEYSQMVDKHCALNAQHIQHDLPEDWQEQAVRRDTNFLAFMNGVADDNILQSVEPQLLQEWTRCREEQLYLSDGEDVPAWEGSVAEEFVAWSKAPNKPGKKPRKRPRK
jgi:hypothetical protein